MMSLIKMFEHKIKIGSNLQPNFGHDITLFKSNCLYAEFDCNLCLF